MADEEEKAVLEIDARVVRQLGAELITDPEQALLELIKNSYDADADRCRVTIDTRVEADRSSEDVGPGLVGRISVEDDGPGINLDDVKKRWLLISGSEKRPAEGARKIPTSKKKRAPLGDKGIGRLGTMRLGDKVTFVSRRKGTTSPAHGVAFRWSQFSGAPKLSDVPVEIVSLKPNDGFSTLVRIEGLEEKERWEQRGDSELQAQVSKLVSPFSDKHELHIEISINGDKMELQKLRRDLNLYASARYSFSYAEKDNHLNLTCEFADSFFGRRWVPTQAQKFYEDFVKARPEAGLQLVKKSGTIRWIYRIKREIDCGTMASFDSQHSPGSFSGEMYSVSFDNEKAKEGAAAASPSGSLKRFFQKLSGVMIYRDGFGIRIPADWLEFGTGVTSGGSWYGLRLQNTVGHIDITTEGNSALVEKSDREGFVDNPAWRQFSLIASKIRDEANGLIEDLRRAAAPGAKKATVDQQTAETAISALARDAGFGRDARRALSRQQDVLTQAIDLAGSLPSDKKATTFKIQAQKALQEIVKQNRSPISAAPAEDSAALLKSEFQSLRNQIRTAYDFIAAGMAAETLAHEVHPILDRALKSIADAEKIVRKAGLKEASLSVQAARAYVRLVGKQLTTLDPMLKIYRETKETIDVAKFIDEYRDYVSDRMNESGIALRATENKSFHVQLPRGRLMQVIDNLVRNSEFWLTVPSAVKKTPEPRITIEIRKPTITVWDNGLGVRPELGNRIFEMFVTDKDRGEGRGLGLFITREILMRYGCDVSLDDETNAHGRRFRFVVDLTAVAA